MKGGEQLASRRRQVCCATGYFSGADYADYTDSLFQQCVRSVVDKKYPRNPRLKRNRMQLLILLLLLLLLTSCERRPLVDPESSVNYAEVVVEFDWELAGMSPTGMTAIFYPTDGGTPLVHKTGDLVSTVRLREGTYHVVGFNYSFDEFDGILFRGTDRYETIEAYATPQKDVTTRGGTQVTGVTAHPDILAVDRIGNFEVTAEMVRQTTEQVRSRQTRGTVTLANADTRSAARVVLTPMRAVAPGYVKVHLKGLNYVRSARGVITGLSGSYFLGEGKASPESCAMVFDFGSPTYNEGSKLDGTVEGSFTTFGLLPEDAATRGQARYGLLFSATLVDKEQTSFEPYFDVTDLIRQEVDVNLNILLRLDIEIGEVDVPEVKPDDEGAFDVNVGDWGEEENVYL